MFKWILIKHNDNKFKKTLLRYYCECYKEWMLILVLQYKLKQSKNINLKQANNEK